MSRDKRDSKVGFGGPGKGKGRFAKQNTKDSTNDFEFRGGSGRGPYGADAQRKGRNFGKSAFGGGKGGFAKGGGGKKRLGKSKRMAKGGR